MNERQTLEFAKRKLTDALNGGNREDLVKTLEAIEVCLETEDCYNCHGEGKAWDHVEDVDLVCRMIRVECYQCKGKGRVPIKKEKT